IAIRPRPRLPPALPRSGVSTEARLALRQLLGDVDRRLAVEFRRGTPAAGLTRERARTIESVLTHVLAACLGEARGIALFAVGGFGRGFLFPYSDVDLLLLAEPAAAVGNRRAIESFFACLWDLGVNPSHALRDPEQCRALAAADVSVFTSLVDARLLAGDVALAKALDQLIADPELWPPARFLAAKRDEQAERHARFDDTAHNLEPNIKEGPGGLRSLDLLRWLGRRIADAGDFNTMVARGLLDPAERAQLADSEATLHQYRYALHMAAGRAEERLLFDHQRTLAAMLGFADEHAQNLAVEQFMQGYYRAATHVARLTTQLLERFDELLDPPADPPRRIDADFVARGALLEPATPDLFEGKPEALIEAFARLADHAELRGLSADAMRAMQHALIRHGVSLAANGQVLAAFLAVLRRERGAVAAISGMNRSGVLSAILPAFARVAGRMQYDLFHVYTVDEHTMRVLRNVARFAEPASRDSFPMAREIHARLDKPELLLLAALFHDIAKGRGGDHSVLGEDESRAFCVRLGLPTKDIERVAWLVRWHLLMSVTAQRRDITDPDVVHHFATQIGDRDRLDRLYLMTIADIAGTSPKLWNAWKARLLSDLYVAARYALRAGLQRPPNADERIEACRERALALLEAQGIDRSVSERVWVEFPETSFLRHLPEQIVWQTRTILARRDPTAPLVAVLALSVRGSSELFVHTPDRDGLFAAITACLDRLRLSVVEARVLSSGRGIAFDTFLLLDAESQAPIDAARARQLETTLLRILAEPNLHARAVRRGLSRRLRHFLGTPRIEFSDDGPARTQLALVCSDRPGLLAQVAQVFRGMHVRVHDARIATFGERVEDFFQLSDNQDRALSVSMQVALRDALLRRLGAASTETRKERHA
ncbi:MAG: [protein-PII] uridylyltransferase, partial [Rhodanobacteraceae bacterium]